MKQGQDSSLFVKNVTLCLTLTLKGSNSAAGPFSAKVNMSLLEPSQWKSHLPQYASGKLVELQEKFDQLKELGVFKCTEDVGVSDE